MKLLGPPEIAEAIANHTPSHDEPFDPLALFAGDHALPEAQATTPQKILTENESPTYAYTGDPCVDLFFHVVPKTPVEVVLCLLATSWRSEPLTTLKLICNLRDIRGKGKSDKTNFHVALLWLYKHHPETLLRNLPKAAAHFGCIKDMPELLRRVVSRDATFPTPRKTSQKSRAERRLEEAVTAVVTYEKDERYRKLYDVIAEYFAITLAADLKALESERKRLTLAAKWCPSPDASYDLTTCLCEGIAKRMFPAEALSNGDGIDDAQHAYRARDALRKRVLVPLRSALQIPEIYISARRWNDLPYERVPSVAMKTYKELFLKRDVERFKEFLDKVSKGEKKIAAGALLPHEIAVAVRDASPDDESTRVLELQWERIVADTREAGTLGRSLAVCDVSGSMHGTPMDVCIALGLLLAECTSPPWRGKLLTFHSHPTFQVVKGDNLRQKIECLQGMPWGMNTNFQRVFDCILNVAALLNLGPEQMPDTLFVFSDMEFDQASENPWETDYEAIVRKFAERGFEKVPQIVFWNLRSSKATPVPSNQPGVALVSGFSKNLFKLFVEGQTTKVTPRTVMELAIEGPEYEDLIVVD